MDFFAGFGTFLTYSQDILFSFDVHVDVAVWQIILLITQYNLPSFILFKSKTIFFEYVDFWPKTKLIWTTYKKFHKRTDIYPFGGIDLLLHNYPILFKTKQAIYLGINVRYRNLVQGFAIAKRLRHLRSFFYYRQSSFTNTVF